MDLLLVGGQNVVRLQSSSDRVLTRRWAFLELDTAALGLNLAMIVICLLYLAASCTVLTSTRNRLSHHSLAEIASSIPKGRCPKQGHLASY